VSEPDAFVTVAVRVTDDPSSDGFGAEVKIVEVPGSNDWITWLSAGEDVEVAKLSFCGSSVNTAVIGCVPGAAYAGVGVHCAVEVVPVALDTATFEQIVVAPSLKSTVPVGLFGIGSWVAP
jgi:hypothetical protein